MTMTREEAIKVLEKYKRYAEGILTDEVLDSIAFGMAIEALSAEPNCKRCAIRELWKETEKEDLVSVVRCKDCKHWTEEKDEEDDILYGWCRAPFENDNLLVYGDDATRIFTMYDFFCKSGERREE